MWDALRLAAVLALTLPAFAAPSLPLNLINSISLNVANSTVHALEAPQQATNLTYRKWPPRPYKVLLRSPQVFLLMGLVTPIDNSAVGLPAIRRFLKDFGDNIAQESPPPGFAPRYSREWTINIESYTRWDIYFDDGILPGGFRDRRLRTAVALDALKNLGQQMSTFGPAEVWWSVNEVGSRIALGHGAFTVRSI